MRRINYLAIIVSVIATFVLSGVWYTVFLNQYFALRGIDPNDAAATVMHPWEYLVVLVRHLVVALVLAYLLFRLDIKTLGSALKLGLLLWLGFPVVLLAGAVASDKVPFALAAIHGGDWLIKLLLMSAIIGVWRKAPDDRK